MKQEIKAKNENIHDRGLIRRFFEFSEKFRPSNFEPSNQDMAIRNGRYYRLIVAETTNVQLNQHFWFGQASERETNVAKNLFNGQDANIAIIVSELGDLHLTSLGMTEYSKFGDGQNNSVSHFSDLECFKRAEQNIDDDPALKLKLEQMEQRLQSSNEWTEDQLNNQFRLSNVALFRFETGACLSYDWNTKSFCDEPVVQNSSWCCKHAQEGKDLKLIKEMGTVALEEGILLLQGVRRARMGPEKLNKVVEYAPSLEGAAPAFRHSMENLEKLLEAANETFKAGFLDSIKYFDDREFKRRFPNAKFISTDRWKHAYLALKETMQAYAFDLKANWTRYVPFLVGKLGVYQGWINADDILDQKKWVSSRYEYEPRGTIGDLLKDMSRRAKPVAPALVFDVSKMDGTCTPSTQSTDYDGQCAKMEQNGQSFQKASVLILFKLVIIMVVLF